jgi:hypothetical protein
VTAISSVGAVFSGDDPGHRLFGPVPDVAGQAG